jgi:hypothetical protein
MSSTVGYNSNAFEGHRLVSFTNKHLLALLAEICGEWTNESADLFIVVV